MNEFKYEKAALEHLDRSNANESRIEGSAFHAQMKVMRAIVYALLDIAAAIREVTLDKHT